MITAQLMGLLLEFDYRLLSTYRVVGWVSVTLKGGILCGQLQCKSLKGKRLTLFPSVCLWPEGSRAFLSLILSPPNVVRTDIWYDVCPPRNLWCNSQRHWLISWLAVKMIEWFNNPWSFIDALIHKLISWLYDWLIQCSIDLLMHWLINWLDDKMIILLSGPFIHWCTDSSIG